MLYFKTLTPVGQVWGKLSPKKEGKAEKNVPEAHMQGPGIEPGTFWVTTHAFPA